MRGGAWVAVRCAECGLETTQDQEGSVVVRLLDDLVTTRVLLLCRNEGCRAPIDRLLDPRREDRLIDAGCSVVIDPPGTPNAPLSWAGAAEVFAAAAYGRLVDLKPGIAR